MTPMQTEIVTKARTLLGVRWSHQGRTTGRTDCLGLVLYAAQAQGLEGVDIPNDYDRHAGPEAMVSVCRKHLIEISRAELQPADIVVLRYPKVSTNHIGLVADYHVPGHVALIHAQASHPHCVVENRLDDGWLKMVGAYVAGCFRFPEKVA